MKARQTKCPACRRREQAARQQDLAEIAQIRADIDALFASADYLDRFTRDLRHGVIRITRAPGIRAALRKRARHVTALASLGEPH